MTPFSAASALLTSVMKADGVACCKRDDKQAHTDVVRKRSRSVSSVSPSLSPASASEPTRRKYRKRREKEELKRAILDL